MLHYSLPLIAVLIFIAFPANAQKITQEKLEIWNAECSAVEKSGSYASVDHENATRHCLEYCPTDLKIFNNRYAGTCIGAYNTFKKKMAEKFDAPIPRVKAVVDYGANMFWKVKSAENAQVSKHCKNMVLTSAKSYPAPIKGHHMMTFGNGEQPAIASATEAILINVRLPADKANSQGDCTAEVINLRCPPYMTKLEPCNF